MPAIGPEITRRAWLLALLAGAARAADPSQEAWEVITGMAAALGRSDAGEFLAVCDPAIPGYASMRANLVALVAQAEVESAIDPVENAGDDQVRNLEVDWSMRLVGKSALQRVTSRREVVKVRLEIRSRKWKVVALDPISLFAPPLP